MSYNARIQTKIDTLANWTVSNPVLLLGEAVIATNCPTDNGPSIRLKIGDGASTFNSLAFLDADVVESLKNMLVILDEHAQHITDLQTQMSSVQTVYTGSGAPAVELGNDGDIYLDIS